MKEPKITIMNDLKRMIESLNKNEKNELFNYLKNMKKSNFVILSNNEFNKMKSSLNEAYNKGYDDCFKEFTLKKCKNNEDNKTIKETSQNDQLNEKELDQNLKKKNIEKINKLFSIFM